MSSISTTGRVVRRFIVSPGDITANLDYLSFIVHEIY